LTEEVPAFERLEAYGFGIDYPRDYQIEFNPKSTRGQGDIALKAPDRSKIFLSWGDLKKVSKYGVEGHADYSVKRISGSREATVEKVTKETRTVNGHPGAYRSVDLQLARRGLFSRGSTTPQIVRSLHVHCDISSRYFVIYGPTTPESSDTLDANMSRMVASFTCH